MKAPEKSSSAQRSASAAVSARGERPNLKLVTGGILFALALAVVLLRLQRLDELPPGLYSDEALHGLNALQIMRGEHSVYFPEKGHGIEGLMAYVVILPITLLGRTELALRLPAALASAGTIFAVLWLGQLLFGRDDESGQATPWRGLLIGGVGAGLLAVSIGQTILGRTAFRNNLFAWLLCLCLALSWEGWRQRGSGGAWWRVALAGVCTGLLPYTYIAARFTPFLFLLFGLSFLLPHRSVTRAQLRAELPWLGLLVGVTGLVAAPILVYFALHPEDFFFRSNQLAVFQPEISQGNALSAFLNNVWEHLLVLGFRGDPYWRHNLPNQPMLNPWQAFFFWLGVGMAVWRWQERPAYRLLILWLVVMILPAMLAIDPVVPSSTRMNGATPAIFLIVGVGIWEAFRFLNDRFFRENVGRAAVIVGTVVSVTILFQGVLTYRTYFHKWPAATGLRGQYEMVWEDLIRLLNKQPSNVDTVYLVPTIFRHESLEYLYQGAAPAHLIYTDRPDLPQEIESTLAAIENVRTVKVVDWNDDGVGGISNIDERVFTLLGKYGRYLRSEEHAGFQIHTYTDILLDRPWVLFEHLEPPTVRYDGGITLNGVVLGHSEEQETLQQIVDLGGARTLWMVLQWQVAPGLELDYSISLRLHDAEGRGVYQKDLILKNWNFEITRSWTADEPVDSLFYLMFPAELPPGEYELRLVVYDYETLKPTVELGVWEAEKVLARLRLEEVE